MEKIQAELQYPIDKHSKSLIVDNVKLLLDYCIRFYDRQFITRENANKDILTRFENIVEDYLVTNASAEKGMLSVQYCADKLCLSASYLGDLLKKETGISALKHIQQRCLMWRKNGYLTHQSLSARLHTNWVFNIHSISAVGLRKWLGVRLKSIGYKI